MCLRLSFPMSLMATPCCFAFLVFVLDFGRWMAWWLFVFFFFDESTWSSQSVDSFDSVTSFSKQNSDVASCDVAVAITRQETNSGHPIEIAWHLWFQDQSWPSQSFLELLVEPLLARYRQSNRCFSFSLTTSNKALNFFLLHFYCRLR